MDGVKKETARVRFLQEKAHRVMLVTTGSGDKGVDFSGARSDIFLSPSFNPASMSQSINRSNPFSHALGDHVDLIEVWTYFASNSYEQRIEDILDSKVEKET